MLHGLGLFKDQIVWRQRGGAPSDHSLTRRRMVATRMRCCGFRSAPLSSGTADGLSGAVIDNIPTGLGHISWCSRDPHAPLDGLDRIATRRTMVDLTSGQHHGSSNRSDDESFGNNEEGHFPPIFVCVVK